MSTAERDSNHFFSLGTQYYVAARAATIAGCFPVAGNLFHHAVELFLKGTLRPTTSREELKKKLGHSLEAVWRRFAALYPTIDLSRFQPVILALDDFEEVRYPDSITDRGMAGYISFAGTPPLSSSSSIPEYSLLVNDVDALIKEVFALSSINPAFYFKRLSSAARTALFADNSAFQE